MFLILFLVNMFILAQSVSSDEFTPGTLGASAQGAKIFEGGKIKVRLVCL